MTFTLIVCTYMRPQALQNVLHSVKQQTVYPDAILIVDGSIDEETRKAINNHDFKNVTYYKVSESFRGLTRQRNFGISQLPEETDVVCFLDDDVILDPEYFKQLLSTHEAFPEALAVGGYITNEVKWQHSDGKKNPEKFYFDGWMRNEPSRFKMRRKFGLLPDVNPGFMPSFSHGRSVSFLPPSGKIYQVEQIMGGVSSYKAEVFKACKFSTYFEGYGLYEDADFSLRLAKKGKLYINTKAQLEHYHDGSGRPNRFKYGKMVLRNGWYVWRVKYSHPDFKSRWKWHATALLLTVIRLTNVLTTKKRQEALTESLGRITSWLSLFLSPPKVKR
ncbi:glycosyltransferase family 2 protein [Aestuariibaculum sp. YM273]|uniref:glycosyltransferase family 2 protein n=1 Tax=Aestuariibaculum sp. YM273 TaxID=3070659 RepID=UPI0027DCC0E7|nr:glycosyltransferase family 2 protein [Aestuariibaculum sp. YM273]WMI65808.1 glycosyltransferase family 2 protein [Aestuariibaculum sp. YM273]